MKTGRSLQEIAAELERQVATRRDYVAPQSELNAIVKDGEVVIDGVDANPLALTEHAHGQLASVLEIPKPYYDRMRLEQPVLLANSVNTWLHAEGSERRMIRTLDGKARAILSPRYRPLDNYDLANVVLPALMERDARVLSAELTETRMYIKAILPGLSDELPAGLEWGVGHHIFERNAERRVVAAIVIANSEVGAGTLRIEPSVYQALCTNLAVLKEAAMKKYHVGRAFQNEDTGYEVYRDETRKADDTAFFLKVRDITVAAFDPAKFAAAVEQMKGAAERKIVTDDLPKVVDVTAKRLRLPEAQSSGILSWLAKGGQLNQYGLSSAITRAAQDAPDYEAATAMERAGGEVLAWTDAEWREVAA